MGWRKHTAHRGERINARVFAYDGTGVEDGVTSYLDTIRHDSTELFPPCGNVLSFGMDLHFTSVALDIRGKRAGAEVGPIAYDAVANVVEMWHLYTVEKDCIFYLRGITYNTFPSDKHRTSKEGALTKLHARTDNGRT